MSGKHLLPSDWVEGSLHWSHVGKEPVLQPDFPWESLFPSRISFAFTGGAKEFICQPHSSYQVLAELLSICNPDCLGGKDRDLEPVFVCCKEWGAWLRHLSVSQQCVKEFLFCYHGLLLFQFANPSTTQITQLQVPSLLPPSPSEDAKGDDATGLSSFTQWSEDTVLTPTPLPWLPVHHCSVFLFFMECFGKGQPVCQQRLWGNELMSYLEHLSSRLAQEAEMLHFRYFLLILSQLRYNYSCFITITYKCDRNSKENTSVCCSLGKLLLLNELSAKAAAVFRGKLVA